MFQRERCFRRLQIECYFLPITFADLFNPAAHFFSKLHDSRHNFLPLTTPPPHTLPFPDPETPEITAVESLSCLQHLDGQGKAGGSGSEVCLEVVSNVSPLLCCYSWLGAVQGVETQVRAFLNHLESCYQ